MLGTFIVEPGTKETERILNNSAVVNPEGSHLHFPVASKLAGIAHHYGFDGWLINIEKPFPKESWDVYLLLCFLNQLKSELGSESQVVWSVVFKLLFYFYPAMQKQLIQCIFYLFNLSF